MAVEDLAKQGDAATRLGLVIGDVLTVLFLLAGAYAFLRGFF